MEIDGGSVRKVPQCRLETLVLNIFGVGQRRILHRILHGKIRKSLKRLKVEGIGHLVVENVEALAGPEVLEEIDIGGYLSGDCLRAMGERSGVVWVLQRARVKMRVEGLSSEKMDMLCKIWIDELEVGNLSVRTMALLFSQAVGSRLAGRLRVLKLCLGIHEHATSAIESMPFTELERLELDVFCDREEGPAEALDALLGNSLKSRVVKFFIGRQEAEGEEGLALVEGLTGIRELRLMCSRLERGDLRRILAGKEKLERLEIYTTVSGITAEDARTMMATESLKFVSITEHGVMQKSSKLLLETEGLWRDLGGW